MILGIVFLFATAYEWKAYDIHNSFFYLYFTLGVVLCIYSLYYLFQILSHSYEKSFLESQSVYGLNQSLDNDPDNGLYGVYFYKDRLLYACKKPFVIPYNNIVWAYIQRRTIRHIGPNPNIVRYSLFIYDDKKNRHKMTFKKNAQAIEVLDEIKKFSPYAYYGYINDYYDKYNSHFDEMVSEINTRKNLQKEG